MDCSIERPPIGITELGNGPVLLGSLGNVVHSPALAV